MNTQLEKLFSDCKTDEEKYNFFLSGRGYETGVVAASIQNDVAIAYKRCVSFQDELRRLHQVNQELVEALQNLCKAADNGHVANYSNLWDEARAAISNRARGEK